MIVKITYDDQRLDVFDTCTFTASHPLGERNMLTNFEVRFDTIGEGGLWLATHGYLATESSEGEDVPVARRAKGWRFLLSSAEELEHVELVVVDGEAILKRVFGQLIDLQGFDEKAYECIGASSCGLHERIARLYEYLGATTGEREPSIPGVSDETARMAIEAFARAQRSDDEKSEKEWGDVDEAGW